MKIKLLNLCILVILSISLFGCATSPNPFISAMDNIEYQYRSGIISENEYLHKRQEIITLASSYIQSQSYPQYSPNYSYRPTYIPKKQTIYYDTKIVGPITTRCRSDGTGGVTCTTN